MEEPKIGIAVPLLAWFQKNRRSLPFREDPTPYHIWVSEIMLQQTRMTTVLPYYARFTERYPTPTALALADTEELHKLWEGLGYYSRADNLHRAAGVIVSQFGGELPRDVAGLLSLPGVGEYTAGAIGSISYNLPVAAVDGNVLRVFSRLFNDRSDILDTVTKERVTARVLNEQPPARAGDFNQALMELGALVCTPGEPDCEHCPLSPLCEGYKAGTASMLPYKKPKPPRKTEDVTVCLLHSEKGWLLQKRPSTGLLKGLWQPLTFSGILTESEILTQISALLPECSCTLEEPLAPSRHIFTHIEWHLTAWRGTVTAVELPEDFAWVTEAEMEFYAVPNAFKAYKDLLYGAGQMKL